MLQQFERDAKFKSINLYAISSKRKLDLGNEEICPGLQLTKSIDLVSKGDKCSIFITFESSNDALLHCACSLRIV